jgi:hypothetical protein
MVSIKKSNPSHRKFRVSTGKSVKDNGLIAQARVGLVHEEN